MRATQVKASDISIVFQGPPQSRSRHVLEGAKSARRIFPEAELIFSTWDTAEITDEIKTVFDKIITSPVVASCFFDPFSGVEDNGHRQVITTMAGLKAATRAYAFKVRSDMVFTSREMAVARQPLLPENPSRIVKEALSVLSSGTIDPAQMPYLFHVGDLAMFGRTEDMKNYWNASLPFQNIGASAWAHLRHKLWFGRTGFRFTRTSVEQRLLLDFLSRNGHATNLGYIDQVTAELAYRSETAIFGNMHIVPTETSGLDVSANLRSFDAFCYRPPYAVENMKSREDYCTQRYPLLCRCKYLRAFSSPYFYKGIVALMMILPLKITEKLLGRKLVKITKK